MTQAPSPAEFAAAAEKELHEGILKFWVDRSVDEENGGFHGEIGAEGRPVADAPKSLVLNARTLWALSSAARHSPDHPDYRALADRACAYLLERFVDREHGGLFWSLDTQGRPLDTRKQVFGQAFTIYGLAEYHKLTQDESVLEAAIDLYDLLEEHAMDTTYGGYIESMAADWSPLEVMRLSERDLEAPKSFNTNLHVMEAYANLFTTWKDPTLEDALTDIVRVHLDHIYSAEGGHFLLFFNNDWKPMGDGISYGHDIEASWLLHWAAEMLEDSELVTRVRLMVKAVAEATLRDGIDKEVGGIFHEGHASGDQVDTDKHWWPQIEAAVGFLDAWQLLGDQRFYDAAWSCWDFAQTHLRDARIGEWHPRADRHGTPFPGESRAGFWKCPYHTVRGCQEIVRRLNEPMG